MTRPSLYQATRNDLLRQIAAISTMLPGTLAHDSNDGVGGTAHGWGGTVAR